jgi:hypothetical protein
MHATLIEAVPTARLLPLAEATEKFGAVIADNVMFARHVEKCGRRGRLASAQRGCRTPRVLDRCVRSPVCSTKAGRLVSLINANDWRSVAATSMFGALWKPICESLICTKLKLASLAMPDAPAPSGCACSTPLFISQRVPGSGPGHAFEELAPATGPRWSWMSCMLAYSSFRVERTCSPLPCTTSLSIGLFRLLCEGNKVACNSGNTFYAS